MIHPMSVLDIMLLPIDDGLQFVQAAIESIVRLNAMLGIPA
jgi:hypothetical protein